MTPNYPYYPPNYQQAVVKKSGGLKWVLITLVCILLVSGGISVMVISAIRARQQAARQIAEEELAPPVAPAPPPPPPVQGAGLEQYKYPNARVEYSVRAFGNESMTMTTDDNFGEVKDYYKERLGAPMLESEDDATAAFQISDSPMTIITINQDKKDPEKTQITVVRSKLQIPKIN